MNREAGNMNSHKSKRHKKMKKYPLDTKLYSRKSSHATRGTNEYSHVDPMETRCWLPASKFLQAKSERLKNWKKGSLCIYHYLKDTAKLQFLDEYLPNEKGTKQRVKTMGI